MNDDDATRRLPDQPDEDEPRTEEPFSLDQPTIDHPPSSGPMDENTPTPTHIPPFDAHLTGDPNPTVTHEIPGPPFDPWSIPRLPTEIPGYELLSLIGRGGLGAVYRARHQEFGIEVAIKVVTFRPQPEVHRDVMRQVVGRLARLRHPNVASTYGLDVFDDYLYLVMELVDGRPLNRLGGPGEPKSFAIRETAGLLEQIARGAGSLHARGILHRDLKPGNILVDSQGRPRVTDFGLAMCLAEQGVDIWPEEGTIVGTPHFMAPEQAFGRIASFGPQLDVWALGATLRWMLTGAPLFPLQNMAELLLAVRDEEPPALRSLRHDVPPELEAIERRCLQRDPARRYPDGNALADDLRRFLDGTPVVPARKRPWWAFWRK
jgi:serine/threonine-protein kinase